MLPRRWRLRDTPSAYVVARRRPDPAVLHRTLLHVLGATCGDFRQTERQNQAGSFEDRATGETIGTAARQAAREPASRVPSALRPYDPSAAQPAAHPAACRPALAPGPAHWPGGACAPDSGAIVYSVRPEAACACACACANVTSCVLQLRSGRPVQPGSRSMIHSINALKLSLGAGVLLPAACQAPGRRGTRRKRCGMLLVRSADLAGQRHRPTTHPAG